MAISTYKPMPTLNLSLILPENRIAEILKFVAEHKESHKSVLVKKLDGTHNYVMTDITDDSPVLQFLVKVPPYAPSDAVITVRDPSDIVKTFMDLTAYTVPHGWEFQFYDETLKEHGFIRNERGNYWLTIGDGSSKTLFVGHLDTADNVPMTVSHIYNADTHILHTKGDTILGADDRAGVAVMFYLISQKVAGHYLLVIGEECGCIGSSDEAKFIEKGKYDRAIEFDRMGTSEIITHQLGVRTASRQFARALAHQLNKSSKGVIRLEPSDRGMYTDTNQFTEVISECTNVAIGYTHQHTQNENQDMHFLIAMAQAAALVNWDALPTKQPHAKKIAYGRYKWYEKQADVDADTHELNYDAAFFGEDNATEKAKSTVWEMWAKVDSGEWDDEDVRQWLIYNPALAAKIIVQHFVNNPTESLDNLTLV